ncbi:hypothetical protein BTI679_19010 [Bacillus wiedmannii]|nr:hypothetical protein BTI679_19010 [Bacillus wiedmannii]
MQGEIRTEKNVSYIGKLLLPVKVSPYINILWIGQLFSTLGSSITMVSYCHKWRDNDYNTSYISTCNNGSSIMCTKYSTS